MTAKRPRGRPVEAALAARLIAAAVGLIEEKRSFEAVSVEAVCAAAGASKASFYRRWKDRDAFVAAMMESLREPPLPAGPTASLEDDLIGMIEGMFGTDMRRTRIVHAALVMEGRRNRAMIEAYLHDVVKPRRAAVSARLRKAAADGDIAPDSDIAILHELLTAPVLKFMLLTDPDIPVPHDFVPRLVRQILRGARPALESSGDPD